MASSRDRRRRGRVDGVRTRRRGADEAVVTRPPRPRERRRGPRMIIEQHTGDKIWKEAARFFAEVSQMFEELVTYEVRDDQEIEHCTSVLSASGLKVQEKKAHYDKVQATIAPPTPTTDIIA